MKGDPVPQGSMRAFAVKGKAFTTSSNAGPLGRYRNDIRAQWGNPTPTDQPVDLLITFYFKRPQSHFNAKGELKGKTYKEPAPTYVTKKPDVDKLCRAVLDALTDYAYEDDAQVIRLDAVKRWADEGASTHIDIAEVS